MATRIIECSHDSVGMAVYPRIVREQTPLTATASSQLSAVIGAGVSLIVVDTDEAIHVTTLGTATTSSIKLAAGSRIEFDLMQGATVAFRTV